MNDQPTNEIEYSEYEDEYGTVAMFYNPENHRAWIRSSTTVSVRQ